MAPLAGHDKFPNGFAGSRSCFAVFIRLGKGGGVTGIANGDGCDGVPALRNIENLASLIRIEASHLVDAQAARGGFDGQ